MDYDEAKDYLDCDLLFYAIFETKSWIEPRAWLISASASSYYFEVANPTILLLVLPTIVLLFPLDICLYVLNPWIMFVFSDDGRSPRCVK